MHLKRLSFCACLLVTTPALADFHYTPFTTATMAPAPANSMANSMDSTPSAPVESAPLTSSPVRTPLMDTTANLNASASNGPTMLTRPSPAYMPMANPTPISAAAPMRLGGGNVIQGFGNRIPLVIALRQIVPESYQFAYGANVPLGSMVDWRGGRPWKDVLMDTLTPLGLTASESGTLIRIDKL